MFIRKSTAKNKDGSRRDYFQLVESVRVDGRSRHRIICTLGRSDDPSTQEKIAKMAESLMRACDESEFIRLTEDLCADYTKEYGPFLVFKRLFSELGMEDILKSHFSQSNADFDVTDALFNMMLNRLTEPTSKRQLNLWEEEVEGINPFDLHQYYRALDYLIEKKDPIEKDLFFKMRDLFYAELDIVLFDTTTLVYYGEGSDKNDEGEKPEDEELLDFGFSKDRRSDLKQVVVGVVMSKEGIPLAHEVFSGNTNDVTCFSEVIETLKKKYSLARVILVGDRGMISKANIKLLDTSELQYILGFRMRTIAKEARAKILSHANLRKLNNHELEFKEVDYEGQRLVVCYNAERAEKDKEHREREVKKLREKIKGKNVKNLISNPQYKRFILVNDSGTRVEIDEAKVKADALYDGVFVLTTSTKLSSLQTVERYKDLWQVESAFRQLKSELEMGPIYHWKDRRIRAHIMICFMAFCLRVCLYKKLKSHFKKESFSMTALMHDLKALRTIGLSVKNTQVKIRTELKDGAVQIFNAIGMRPPNRILQSGNRPVVIRRPL
jgi:transposase